MAYYPYLFFGSNCREAFTRYQEIFGGQLDLVTAGDMPAGDRPPGDNLDLIMNASLVAEDGSQLYGSDDPTADQPYGPAQRFNVNYSTADVGEVKRVYDALVEGGTATMPPGETSWSPLFGMCTDRFGIPWMIMAEPPEQG